MSEILEPAKRPCGTCPYRLDVPSGLWEAHEYEKLPQYDGPIHEQDATVFMCHQENGCLCSGWVATHDMYENLGFRIAAFDMPTDRIQKILDYTTDVPLHESGTAVAEFGLRDYKNPSEEASKAIAKLKRKRQRASK